MQITVTENCPLIQSANDTLIFSSSSDANQAVETIKSHVKNLIEFFESHLLTIIADKKNLSIFTNQKTTQNSIASTLLVKGQDKNVSKSKNYSVVHFD